MGLTYAEIELINAVDIQDAKRSYIDQDEIRRMHVTVLVDTGALLLAINENIQQILQLPVTDKKQAQLANGECIWCDIVGPVELRFKNRASITSAMVLPGNAEPLLGSIPLEEMDVVVDPVRQELAVHPDRPDFALVRVPTLLPPKRDYREFFTGPRPPWVKMSGRRSGENGNG